MTRTSRRERLTAERLRECLNYDPGTGVFRWLVTVRRKKVGDMAGGVCLTHGYRRIKIDQRQYRASRLAWLYMTGEFPPSSMEVDHKNRIKSDDRWDNLRLATRAQNKWNEGRPRHNKTGYKGVRMYGRKFHARIVVDGHRHHLGSFDTALEAFHAYRREARLHRGQFARTE